MYNYGNKRGYNNNSGFLYTQQGCTNSMKYDDVVVYGDKGENKFNNLYGEEPVNLPNFVEPMPYYVNKEHVERVLTGMNNSIKKKEDGSKPFKIMSGEHEVGGGLESVLDVITSTL